MAEAPLMTSLSAFKSHDQAPDETENHPPMNTTIDVTGWNTLDGEGGFMLPDYSLVTENISSDEGDCPVIMIWYSETSL